MKKNTASQRVGVQMITAADGTAFTGSVTVAVTLDAGTQATGTVGSGACTHEGNGYHTYAPSQAETNGDLAAFTFTGTGAIPATVQVYTSFPQTGDSFALIGSTGSGLTSLASQTSVNTVDDFLDTEMAAVLAAVDTEVAAIKAKTDQLTFTTANKVDSTIQAAADLAQAAADKVWSTAARVLTAGTNIALAKGTGVTGFTDLSAAQVNAEVDTAISDAALATATNLATLAGYVDTEVAAIKTKTDSMVFTVANRLDVQVAGTNTGVIDAASLATDAVTEIRDAIMAQVLSGLTTAGTFGDAMRRLNDGATGIVKFTVGASSSTTVVTSNLTEATNDHYNGRTVVFISGALLGQASTITDYNGATKELTVSALTEAPTNADLAIIV